MRKVWKLMIYFIVNKSSRTGKGADIWHKVKAVLSDKNVEYKAYRTEYKGHATKIARKIMEFKDEDAKIVILGGDGTINEVINGIDDFSKVKFGIIPTGSGNDFARGLGISKSIEENINKIINGDTRYIDVGRVIFNDGKDSRYFAISSGLGLDAIVCKKALASKLKKVLNKLHMGKLTYLLLTVQTLLTMSTEKMELSHEGEKTSYEKMIFCAAMNLKAEGGGVPMAPDASYTDGKLSVCIAKDVSKIGALVRLPLLVMAKHKRLGCFEIKNFETFSVHLSAPVVLHTDGEYCGDVTAVSYECISKCMGILN